LPNADQSFRNRDVGRLTASYKGKPKFNSVERYVHGTPTWPEVGAGAAVGHPAGEAKVPALAFCCNVGRYSEAERKTVEYFSALRMFPRARHGN
jgi:hypothetical protein